MSLRTSDEFREQLTDQMAYVLQQSCLLEVRAGCRHLGFVPVVSGGEEVAVLCADCDEQLPARWRPKGYEAHRLLEQAITTAYDPRRFSEVRTR